MFTIQAQNLKNFSTHMVYLLSLVLVGIASGFLGMVLAYLLHFIQHVAYGYSFSHTVSDEAFLEGVNAASSLRRITVMMICGLVAGLGWWVLYRYGTPLVSIAEALKSNKKMPYIATIIHIILQISTIALGSPLGREVAPREAGALFACWISSIFSLKPKELKIMMACGAGAGLAAVYNVPLGGAVFILEVLLCTFNWSVVLPALLTCAIAVTVSRMGLGDASLYQVPPLMISYSLTIWSLLMGPVFGYFAYLFINVAEKARASVKADWRMPLMSFINFTFIGLLAVYFPSLLGNGKSAAQIEFDGIVGIELSLVLLGLRMLICWTSLRVGAQGGLLTPSLANGALLAGFFGGLWSLFLPGTSSNAFAIIGAMAFLAAAQKMPITAIVLVFEFTRVHVSFLIPAMLAVAGACGTVNLCGNWHLKRDKISSH